LPRDWPAVVDNLVVANLVSGQLKYSEALTTRVVLKGGVPRTYSGFIGQMIISAVE